MEFTKQLKEICERREKEWEDAEMFNASPKEGSPKYFVTFPYPYMNGELHLGHLFSLSKCEFSAGYHRLIGENVLFPFAFHVTGQPICGAAKKLEQELAGCAGEPDCAQTAQTAAVEREEVVGQFKSKKSKAVAKSSGKAEIDILRDLGVPEEEIPKFTDPYHWVDYFPPICQKDLRMLGARVDWRRSFYTTDKNPCYDAFIRWQMTRLKDGGYIKFGDRFTIWSPAEMQPCLDHDRSEGEGLESQEYTLVLAELLRSESVNAAVYSLVAGHETIYFPCATLRPETMCGEVNAWVHPEETYELVRIDSERVIVSGARAALNLAFERKNNGKPEGVVDLICEVSGKDLLNCLLHAPLTPLEKIPVLPLLTISMRKGTGVVTSVPSDAPDDYAALRDIQLNTGNISTKYSIDMEEVADLRPIPIIRIPELGDCAAATLCESRGVKSQYDAEKLKEIKEICYKSGFYEGVMISGPYAGKRVLDCKELYRDELIYNNTAIPYAEPEGLILSRSGSECVVALSEQWYINYGEDAWRRQAEKCLEQLETYSDEVRNQFQHVLGWLKQWAVSRSFGLGTRIPWDERFVVESLSDSTIYNAYYTIAHVLQNNSLNGGNCPIPHILLNSAFFEYVFDLRADMAPEHAPYAALMEEMRSNFRYFYPVDLRCSGRDLVQNHLAFFIYTHVAIFPPKYWPRGVRVNGHLMLDDRKMSKKDGNFLTAEEAIQLYSADGVRFALADAGDGGDDANFKRETAELGVVRLCEAMRACGAALGAAGGSTRSRRLCDDVFEAQFLDAAARAAAAYARCRFRDGMLVGFSEMQRLHEQYAQTCANLGIEASEGLLREFWRLFAQLLSVCCPHTADEMWREILGEEQSVLTSVLPPGVQERAKSQARFLRVYDFVCATMQRLNMRLQDVMREKGGSRPRSGAVYVATEFEPWQAGVCDFLASRAQEGTILEKATPGVTRQHAIDELGVQPRESKRLMKFITDQIQQFKLEGESALATRMPFDEKEVYTEYAGLIKNSLQLEQLEVFLVGEGPIAPAQCGAAAPGRPIIFFE